MHPCRTCDVYLSTGRNHGTACGDCAKRIEYCGSMGSMAHGMPDNLINEKGAFMAPEQRTKICKDPNCSLSGEPQPVANFPGKQGGGTKAVCRKCCGLNIRRAKERRKKAKQDLEAQTVKQRPVVIPISSKQAENDQGPFCMSKSVHNIVLTLTAFPGTDRLALIGLALTAAGAMQERVLPLRKEAAVLLRDMLGAYLKGGSHEKHGKD